MLTNCFSRRTHITRTIDNQRLFYIDALRSFAMLFGLMVHAGTLYNMSALSAISLTSDHFRMATFFTISGFFAALVSNRRGYLAFLTARIQALLVPFVAGLVLIVPLTNWLIYLWHSETIGLLEYLASATSLPTNFKSHSWHLHLWFLAALFFYVAMLPITSVLLNHTYTLLALERLMRTGMWVVPIIGLTAGLHEIGVRVVWQVVFESTPPSGPVEWLSKVTLSYWIYFILGMSAYIFRPLFEAMHRTSFIAFASGISLYGLLFYLPADMPGEAYLSISILAEEIITAAALCMLLVVFQKIFSKERVWVSRLTASAYTIYLFHFPFIYIIALALRIFFDTHYFIFGSAILGAFGLGYALHSSIISRVPVLSYLFNGKSLASLRRIGSAC